MEKKIIITGGTGFVGSNLVSYFLSKSYRVTLIVRVNSDLSQIDIENERLSIFKYDNNLVNLISFFEEVKPICIIHLASNFIAEHQSAEIDGLVASNISFGLHILEAMKQANVKTLINTGTSWQHYNNEEYNPVCLYAATKQAFESLIEYYVQAEGFKVITLKLFDTYGETDTRPKLINLLNKIAEEQTELKMSPGEQMLNLVHINDVCSAFEIALHQVLDEENATHKKYAVSSNESFQLKEVISVFEKVTNKKIQVVWGGKTYRKREVMSLWDKGEKLPNWEAKINLQEGFKRYL